MRIKVTPVENRVVRDPQTTRLVPPEGSEVVATAYWRRLALDGDVTVEEDTVGEDSGEGEEE